MMNLLERALVHFSTKGWLDWMSDRAYIKILYRCHVGKKLDLKNAATFNEKLQWLKLYNRRPEYIRMVDKYLVRGLIRNKIGERYLFPLLGVWDSAEAIDFDALPAQFVLKCTHDSGGLVICRDKAKLDIGETKRTLAHYLKRNYYKLHREWPYKYVKPRIIAEQYMVDESGAQLKDYKFYCFNGRPRAVLVAADRYIDTRLDYFDMNFTHMDVMHGRENYAGEIKKPAGFDEMVRLAALLAQGIPHVRVDFYDIGGRVYFGEMTFFPSSGFIPFKPASYDELFGSWITLPGPPENKQMMSGGIS